MEQAKATITVRLIKKDSNGNLLSVDEHKVKVSEEEAKRLCQLQM